MATSIVIELQQMAASSNASVPELLRKALIVATKLKITDFREWTEKELGGYRGAGNVPEYRRLCGRPMVAQVYTGHRRPFIIPSDEVRESLTTIWVRESIAEIEGLVSKADNALTVDLPDQFQQMMHEHGGTEVMVGRYYLEFSPTAMSGILNQVRDIVLQWALKLEEQGIMGDGLTFSDAEKKAATNNPNIHIGAVYGQVRVNNDSTDNSNNTVNVHAPTPFDALRQACGEIADERARTDAIQRITALEKSTDEPSALQRVGAVAALASHGINIGRAVAQYLPVIMTWIASLPRMP